MNINFNLNRLNDIYGQIKKASDPQKTKIREENSNFLLGMTEYAIEEDSPSGIALINRVLDILDDECPEEIRQLADDYMGDLVHQAIQLSTAILPEDRVTCRNTIDKILLANYHWLPAAQSLDFPSSTRLMVIFDRATLADKTARSELWVLAGFQPLRDTEQAPEISPVFAASDTPNSIMTFLTTQTTHLDLPTISTFAEDITELRAERVSFLPGPVVA